MQIKSKVNRITEYQIENNLSVYRVASELGVQR